MNPNLETFLNAFGTVLMVTAIPALWISARIVRRNLSNKDRSTQLFLWLALGGLFNIPLVDLLSAVGNLIAQAIPSEQGGLPAGIATTSILWTLIVYAVAAYFGWMIITKNNLLFLRELALTSLERGFIVLGLAGLIDHAVSAFIFNFLLLAFASG